MYPSAKKSISRRSSTLVNGRENSDPIPIDLVIEIFLRLPTKSIARFRCVSSLWASTVRRPEFTELILTRYATHPQLLIVCKKDGYAFFFSSPQPQNPDAKSSSPVAANYHMNFPCDDTSCSVYPPVHGLIFLKQLQVYKGKNDTVLGMICNPSTGQSLTIPRVTLPRVKARQVRSFLGYDPIDKQFKLLSISTVGERLRNIAHIMPLGTRKQPWRIIDCSLPHNPSGVEICINGVLYYISEIEGLQSGYGIACFDIRSENFSYIDKFSRGKLVNYKGKLATLKSDNASDYIDISSRSFELCVLEDAKKREWSTRRYALPTLSNYIIAVEKLYIVGVTRTCEVVLSTYYLSDHLIYYNLEKSTIMKLGIQGMDAFKHYDVFFFLDHVEDVKRGGLFRNHGTNGSKFFGCYFLLFRASFLIKPHQLLHECVLHSFSISAKRIDVGLKYFMGPSCLLINIVIELYVIGHVALLFK